MLKDHQTPGIVIKSTASKKKKKSWLRVKVSPEDMSDIPDGVRYNSLSESPISELA